MLKEFPQATLTEPFFKAIHSVDPKDRLPFSLNGHQVILGVPDIELADGQKKIVIPSTPHIFKSRVVTFVTIKGDYKHKFTLFDQVIILGHGNPKRKDPLGWEFADAQDPLKITADFNKQNSGLPKINTIVSCRRIIPLLRVNALVKKNGVVYQKNKMFPNTQLPAGWSSIPDVIIPKCGIVKFVGLIDDLGISSLVISTASDFYKISKKGRPINLRKKFRNPY